MNDISYRNLDSMTNSGLLKILGHFIQSHRLNQNKSQEEVAQGAGISRSTLSLMERGENVKIDSIIQVLRELELLDVFSVFEINEQISPIEYAKLQKQKRKKASPKKNLDKDLDDKDLW